MISLQTFDGATVEAINDARLYAAITNSAVGKVSGALVTAPGTGLVLHITDGWLIAKGRVCTVEAEDIVVQAGTTEGMRGRLYAHIDLTDTAAPVKLMSVAAATLPAMDNEDLNAGGSRCDVELATYTVGTVSASNVTSNAVISLGGAEKLNKSAFSFDASTATLTLTLD